MYTLKTCNIINDRLIHTMIFSDVVDTERKGINIVFVSLMHIYLYHKLATKSCIVILQTIWLHRILIKYNLIAFTCIVKLYSRNNNNDLWPLLLPCYPSKPYYLSMKVSNTFVSCLINQQSKLFPPRCCDHPIELFPEAAKPRETVQWYGPNTEGEFFLTVD